MSLLRAIHFDEDEQPVLLDLTLTASEAAHVAMILGKQTDGATSEVYDALTGALNPYADSDYQEFAR